MLTMRSAQSCRQTGCRHRWQASSHNGGFDGDGPCRSQLAGDGISSILHTNPVAGIAGKPAPTMVALMGGGSCRSQLAGDGISSILQTKPVAGIAGKPAPTMVALMEADLVGASLLAMGSAQSCRQTRVGVMGIGINRKFICGFSGVLRQTGHRTI